MAVATSKKILLCGNQKPHLERNNSLQRFYNEIKQYAPLTQEETKQLFKLYRNGSKKEMDYAFDKLCKHNLRLVISLARDYCSNDDNLNDLIQEGNIGLIKAIEMFDEEIGTPFYAYSMYWIRRYINIFRTNTTPIVAKTNRSKTANTIVRITNELWQKFERIPTPDEILDEYNSQYPNKPINDTEDLFNVEYVFIDQPYSSTDTSKVSQGYTDYNTASMSHNSYMDEIESDYDKKILEELLDGLNEKEVKVLKKIYGLDNCIETSIGVVSAEMGVSKQRIRQLCATAINKMKKKSEKFSYSFK